MRSIFKRWLVLRLNILWLAFRPAIEYTTTYVQLPTTRSTYSLWAWKYAVKRIPASSVMEDTGPSPGVLRPASPMMDSFISDVSFSSTRHIAFACFVRLC